MDGYIAQLDKICDLADKYDAMVMVDECHATGFMGKTGWEVVMTPVTYRVVAFLKRAEAEDWYDRNTDFSPFRIRV